MIYTGQNKKDEILACAWGMQYYNDLLIAQCDSWLSEEEGLRNMEQRIQKRKARK